MYNVKIQVKTRYTINQFRTFAYKKVVIVDVVV